MGPDLTYLYLSYDFIFNDQKFKIFSLIGDKPGLKGHEMHRVIITSTASQILFNYRQLRKLRFPNEGNVDFK